MVVWESLHVLLDVNLFELIKSILAIICELKYILESITMNEKFAFTRQQYSEAKHFFGFLIFILDNLSFFNVNAVSWLFELSYPAFIMLAFESFADGPDLIILIDEHHVIALAKHLLRLEDARIEQSLPRSRLQRKLELERASKHNCRIGVLN